jgi:hypothetical protein
MFYLYVFHYSRLGRCGVGKGSGYLAKNFSCSKNFLESRSSFTYFSYQSMWYTMILQFRTPLLATPFEHSAHIH